MNAPAKTWSVSTLAFPAWITGLTVQFFFYKSWVIHVNPALEPRIFYTQVASVIVFMLLGMHELIRNLGSNAFFDLRRISPQLVLSIFILYLLFSSLLQDALRSAVVYSCLLWMAFAVSNSIWPRSESGTRAMFTVSVVSILTVLLVLTLTMGYQGNRQIGSVHPNYIGYTCFAVVTMSVLCSRKVFLLGAMVGIAGIVVVNARGAGLAVVLAGLAYYVILGARHSLAAGVFRFVLIGFAVALAITFGSLFREHYPFSLVFDWLQLFDPNRGLGTGIGGRTLIWGFGFADFLTHPMVGSGFRSSMVARSHSGYIDLLRDTGVIGTFIFLSAMVIQLVLLAREAVRTASPYEAKVNAVAASFLFAYLGAFTALETYVSLGLPIQCCVILFLARSTYIRSAEKTGNSLTSNRN